MLISIEKMEYIKLLFCLALLASVTNAWKDSTADLEQALMDILSNKTSIEDSPEIRQLSGKECYAVEPDKPNFLIPGRSISASKCAEYHWILTQKELETKNMEKCRLYLIREIKNGVVPESFFIINSPVIFGGKPAVAGEFPHMGAVGWKSKDSDKPWVFKCGSTLISENFVLTAAHCTKVPLRLAQDIADPIPKIVRFGEENIDDDLFNINGDPTDVNIKRIIPHPDFAPPNRYNDIALMELADNVKFDLNIMPACLWNSANTRSLGDRVALTGWGYTEKGSLSTQLLVAYVDILDSELCDSLLYRKRSRHWQGFSESQICAGNLTGGVDTCQGDSGGPIQVKMNRGNDTEGNIHMVLGVTSFGIKCAKRNVPGIYTRVSTFIPWIESEVWGHLLNYTNNALVLDTQKWFPSCISFLCTLVTSSLSMSGFYFRLHSL